MKLLNFRETGEIVVDFRLGSLQKIEIVEYQFNFHEFNPKFQSNFSKNFPLEVEIDFQLLKLIAFHI